MAGRPPEPDPSGIMVYPKLNVPKDRKSDPNQQSQWKIKGFGGGGGGGGLKEKKKWVIGIAIAAGVGGILGFLFAPSKSGELEKAATEATDAKKAQAVEKDRADGLDKALTALKKDKDAADKQLADLSTKAADVEKRSEKLAEEEKKVQAAIDKSSGSV